jgi:SpoVK/Ycf46/Vps4 family AAA+-type ATPase
MKKLPYFYLLELGKLVAANEGCRVSVMVEKPKIKENILNFKALPTIQEYELTAEEVLLIAICWQAYTEDNYRSFDAIFILEKIFPEEYQQINNLPKMNRLIEKGVLKIEDDILADEDYENSIKLILLKESLEFSPSFLKIILEETNFASSHHKISYCNNQEFLNDWMRFVSQLSELRQRKPTQCSSNLKNFRKKLQSRAQNSQAKLPLLQLKQEYELDEKDIIILIYLMKMEAENKFCETDELLQLISANVHEYYANKKYLTANSKLVKNDLIEISDELLLLSDCPTVNISPDIASQITTKTRKKSDFLQHRINNSTIFSSQKPEHSFADLVLPDELKTTLYSSMQLYNKNVEAVLQKWGILAGKATQNNSLIMLFHGAPGTGKTFAAGAVAQALQKQLLITDISKLQSKWVGESEKNIQKMFREYKKICSKSSNPPILLLNEADQFLMKRTTKVEDAVDKMMNSMQNLFLEGFEQLQGTLIATSNLIQNIDPAFSRRFHLKLKFPKPAPQQRKKLWKLHLPSTIPGDNSIKIGMLAQRYQLTGGQIKIIVKNACTEAANRCGDLQKLAQTDLIKYCELETNGSFNNKPKMVGFGK